MTNLATDAAAPSAKIRRRALLGAGLALGSGALALWPEARSFAVQVGDFIEGGPVPDIAPKAQIGPAFMPSPAPFAPLYRCHP